MNFFEEADRREQIHQLIKLRATGTPKQLAKRLGMSKRSLFRIIEEMRGRGFPIAYDKLRECYYYEQEVTFIFKISVIEENDHRKETGGENFSFFDNFFFRVPDSGTERRFLCGS